MNDPRPVATQKVRNVAKGSIRRHRLAVLIVAGSLFLLPTASAAGAYVYERASADRILPGVRIAGVDVGETTRAEAIQMVGPEAESRLNREITIRVGERAWTRSLAELGVEARLGEAVDRAFAVSESLSWVSRAYHRITDRPVAGSVRLPYRYPRRPVHSLLQDIGAEVSRPARDAAVLLREGEVVFRRSIRGWALDTKAGVDQVMDAIRSGVPEVTLSLDPDLPEVTASDLGKIITIDLSTNSLRLYDGFRMVRRFDVGTAMRGYSTPPGAWKVIDKQENPTWTNPDPEGWGADMPLVIPGGPNNPLGTRALYLDAPGIRIHGTPDTSSVGGYVSHGCIRMRMWEVEELYPLVPIGTPVMVYGAPPWGIVQDPGVAGT